MSDADVSPVKNYFLENEQEGENEESDSGPLGNPTPPPDVDLDKLRGDRIGDTVYSGKWCIQTVMKLMQSNVVIKPGVTEDIEDKADVVDMEEELQNEVGALWDMTSNVEVCQYLHSIGAMESICYVITNSRCPRATEMCVGMLANIITHNELWDILHGDASIFNILIELLTNTDQPVLLEVTRFFNTALCHEEHAKCYSCLCENGSLVTQELMRILSGSTNGDLVKQAAEFTYNLMSLDGNDSHFCAFFADPDFVLAVVEASKELGYDHENAGQNYIMEVFHYWTTYQAGALSLENSMEQIADSCTAYLKFLCHSLNLSNTSTIITTILATLNHIFCRQVLVRVSLMSSPSFIHCVLKTLVAVYRKLGCYKAIAYPKSHKSGHSSKSSAWKTEEDTPPTQTKTSDKGSWSERANQAPSSSSRFRTPDASPLQVQRAKELEISWSERRMSSPLADDDFAEEKWKRPRERKRLRKREKAEDKDETGDDTKLNETSSDTSEAVAADSDKAAHSETTSEKESTAESYRLDENNKNLEVEKEGDAMKIQNKSRLDSKDCARVSSGFSPQRDFEEMDTEQRQDEEEGKSEAKEEVDEKDGGSENNSVVESSTSQSSTGHKIEKADSEEKTMTSVGDVNNQDSISASGDITRTSIDSHNEDSNLSNIRDSGEFDDSIDNNDEDDEDNLGNSDGVNGDKYHKLLEAIKEFLTDYFNNLRETITGEEGSPCISEVMVYFNTQCSSTEIRAIVKCVGADTQPLGRLLHMCDHFKAKHMKRILLDFAKKQG